MVFIRYYALFENIAIKLYYWDTKLQRKFTKNSNKGQWDDDFFFF